ncbi:MAG: beta-hydroxyacyl-ACP dehydratase [Acholeplasmataceae bacterium]|nr:MAG: beta-hydroxyacyl-ACP dehydratase [Acholeplasmataceae bacterium]
MMTQHDIKAVIPHREPFLLLDEIRELVVLKRAVGIKHVRPDEAFFEGHFPEKPVMPGVLIIESLAQVGAVILLAHPDYQGKIAYFTGIRNAKFRKSVQPGDTLELVCELTRLRGAFGIGKAEAYVDGQLVCEAEISFAVGE